MSFLNLCVSKSCRYRAARSDVNLSDNERKLVEVLWYGALDIDSLSDACGLPIQQVSSMLIGLELKRVVRMLPGRFVELRDDLIHLIPPKSE